MMEEFTNSDSRYREWLTEHPQGYVLNTRRRPDPDYMVLHRSECRSISRPADPGAFTERSYIKVCSDTRDDLQVWARQYGAAGFSKRCSL
jgi:hypothetical protein